MLEAIPDDSPGDLPAELAGDFARAHASDRWSFAPAPGARTLGELVAHLYGAELACWKGFQKGALTQVEHDAEVGPPVKSRSEAFALMARAHARRGEVLAYATPAELEREVALFYGRFKGSQVAGFVYDEHWHHRGQLTVYLRCLGIAPPFLYAG
ncbi:MAG: DinB family protein [Planctomycetes bacterium]|nr:DinB family protein [Planctomycetota bacterium]